MEKNIDTQNIDKDAAQIVVSDAAPGRTPKPWRPIPSLKLRKPTAKSKQDQLVALLSKPNGIRVSVISERLGWQAHTVRAAISGLRKRGYQVVTSKSPKTGEMVYAINAAPKENEADDAETSS